MSLKNVSIVQSLEFEIKWQEYHFILYNNAE